MITVNIPARVNLIPAKRMVEGMSFSGSISSYPVLIKGVALPQSAQHISAKSATIRGFEKIGVFFSLSILFSFHRVFVNRLIITFKIVFVKQKALRFGFLSHLWQIKP